MQASFLQSSSHRELMLHLSAGGLKPAIRIQHKTTTWGCQVNAPIPWPPKTCLIHSSGLIVQVLTLATTDEASSQSSYSRRIDLASSHRQFVDVNFASRRVCCVPGPPKYPKQEPRSRNQDHQGYQFGYFGGPVNLYRPPGPSDDLPFSRSRRWCSRWFISWPHIFPKKKQGSTPRLPVSRCSCRREASVLVHAWLTPDTNLFCKCDSIFVYF